MSRIVINVALDTLAVQAQPDNDYAMCVDRVATTLIHPIFSVGYKGRPVNWTPQPDFLRGCYSSPYPIYARMCTVPLLLCKRTQLWNDRRN